MYIPSTFDFGFAHEEMGVYGPKAHQRVISKLNSGLGSLFYRDSTIKLEPLPETMLDDSQPSPVPDLILYDNTARQTRVIIEICHTEGFKRDLRKVIKLIDEDDFGIREGFVYDYIDCQWLRYKKGDGGIAISTSYSDELGLDLNQFL